jgi:hypothetical protein
VLVVCVLVAVMVVGVWTGAARMQRDGISVTWSGPVQCTGSRVTQESVSESERPIQAMRLQPSMRCRLPVRIANEGWAPVEMERVRLPYMGPGGGAAVQVAKLDGRRPLADPEIDVDAVFEMRHRLPAGSTDRFVIEFTFRPRGCTAEGLMWVSDMPEVTIKALGRSGQRSPSGFIGFRGTPESDNCST